MNKKIYVSFLGLLIAVTALVVAVGRAGRNASAAPAASATLSALPPSDVVVYVDTQRLVNDSLPSLLATNPTALAKLNAKVDQFREEFNIDPRAFESLAVGGRYAPAPHDFNAVVIARGSFDASSLINTGFAAARRKHKTMPEPEQREYKGKTLFVVKPNVRADNRRVESDDRSAQSDDKRRQGEEFAVVALDSNTFAAGDLESVMAAIDANNGGAHVDAELVALATRTSDAVVGFSGKMPKDMKQNLRLGSDDIAQDISYIRQFYGSLRTSGPEAEALVGLQTETAEQARSLNDKISSLKQLARLYIPFSSGRNEAASRLLNNLSNTTQNNEVQINFRFTQADVAPFVRYF